MALFIDMEKTMAIVKNLYRITGLQIAIRDNAENMLAIYPDEVSNYCGLIRQEDKIYDKCKQCDAEMYEECRTTKKPVIRRCHAGLIDALVPIVDNTNSIKGYISFGRICDEESRDLVVDYARRVTKKYDFNLKSIESALDKITYMPMEKIEACAEIFSLFSTYCLSNKLFFNKTDDYAEIIKNYVYEHMSEDLSAPSLCSALHISESTLYNVAKKYFGMGICQYVTQQRILYAAYLLQYKEQTISNVAATVGIYDANYFTKIFKKHMGQTPREYQKTHSLL